MLLHGSAPAGPDSTSGEDARGACPQRQRRQGHADRDGVQVPYCTVLYCTVLYCTVLYCTVLYRAGGVGGAGGGRVRSASADKDTRTEMACRYRILLYCTVLYRILLYCAVLYCTVLYCTVLYCTGRVGWAGPPARPPLPTLAGRRW